MNNQVVRIVLSPNEALVLAATLQGACEQLIEQFSQLSPDERTMVAILQDIRKQLPQIPA